MSSQLRRTCSIKEDVFSLGPDISSSANQWIVKSLSAQGWQERASEIDLNEEWGRFTHDLLVLQERGCFPAQESLFTIQRSVAETIPIPASEALLFFYSFTTSGFTDLTPGMQIKIEESISSKDARGHVSGRRHSSVIAEYTVVPSNQTGVALRLSKTVDRGQAQLLDEEGNRMFSLAARFTARPILRLFLQTMSDTNDTQREPMLLGAADLRALDEATTRIETTGTPECSESRTEVTCVSFPLGTVSLLSAIWVNGRPRDYPVGTHIKSLLEALPKGEEERALQTVSLKRRLARGKYVEVLFPKTLVDASKVVLLAGDRVSWKR